MKLKDKYGRIFRLEQDELATVADRIRWSGSEWVFTWCWTRSPSGRTPAELSEMELEISIMQFHNEHQDSWTWSLSNNSSRHFNTCDLSRIIDDISLNTESAGTETLKNYLLPQKFGIFVWRAKMRRLPVRVELDKRGMDLDSLLCPRCNDTTESVDHALFLCKYVMDIWDRVYNWWNIGHVSNLSVVEAFCGNNNHIKSAKGKQLWQVVEWVTGYMILRNRNKKAFENKDINEALILNEIQIRSFEWVNKSSKKLRIDWHQWLINPKEAG
ncbi:uncharacterized protein [Rutidosis leptorrhynchoides]|uniref:uncharacterized protein n=1 Tax=Rutidosis leptorrhynchoides TaxID=125765 RepID=UPI003A995BF5